MLGKTNATTTKGSDTYELQLILESVVDSEEKKKEKEILAEVEKKLENF